MSTLYLVATPIGNLEDISARALRILNEVPVIAAEDTRETLKLLSHFDIHTRLVSYHDHNKRLRADQILAELEKGDVALVSDAGTPALNDPGFELVCAALDRDHQVCPVPGPSAPVAALVASGLPTDAFLYIGYLPRKRQERCRKLAEVADLPYTLVILETPHRLLEALLDIETSLGNREMAVARELTKVFEEIRRGSIRELYEHFSAHHPKGEFTLVVAGQRAPRQAWDEQQLRAAIGTCLSDQLPAAQIASKLAEESGWARRDIYRFIVDMQHTSR